MAGEIVVPGIDYVQLPGKSTTYLQPRFVNVHTMVGTLAGTESYFRTVGVVSHLGLRGDGYSRQWQDLRFRAASDLEGNPYSISIETEDKGSWFPAWSGSDVPWWTAAQVEWLVVNVAWLCIRFGIPPYPVPDSLPGRYGLSYHRLGIDPWRVAGGLRYSSAYGKVCPGDRRIGQWLNEVCPRVLRLVQDITQPKDWFDMATEADLRRVVNEELDANVTAYIAVVQGDPDGAYFVMSKVGGFRTWVDDPDTLQLQTIVGVQTNGGQPFVLTADQARGVPILNRDALEARIGHPYTF